MSYRLTDLLVRIVVRQALRDQVPKVVCAERLVRSRAFPLLAWLFCPPSSLKSQSVAQCGG
jgi:hypothetical protein